MRKRLRALLIDRKAATAVEYGLIVSLIVLAMIASLNGVANATIEMWNYVETSTLNASS
ncbi:Flp family type IVb pilin [Sphingomonas sp. AX6]|uniref:Flp family type IVb pilin n=1 Tax=Sphingomonas sp. AX6 TaxID=2653171 RepID=UPI0012F06347|nr:Flp family type IVb pilin [Sphingomonas sp. AX6]VXC80159.1 Pilus assembly protein [Sphingomonas sp. AX6]